MAEQAYAYVTLIPVAKGFQSAVSKELNGLGGIGGDLGQKAGKGFNGGFSGALKGLLGPVTAALSTVAIANFTKTAVGAASALSAEFEGVNQTFGNAAKSVQAFAEQAAFSAGVSETEALRAAKNFGGFATAAGLAGQQAATFSTDLVQAAGDLASFNDVPVEQALSAIQSGLAGQSEPLRNFRIFMDQATLSAQAAEMGFKGTFSELSQGEQTLVRQAAIMEQLGVQAGDFEKYSGTFGNVLKTVQATFAELQAEVGAALLPALEQLLPELLPIIDMALPVLLDMFDALVPVIMAVAENLGPLFEALMPLFEALTLIIQAMTPIIADLMPVFVDIVAMLTPLMLDLVEAFLPLVERLLPPMIRLIEALLPYLEDFIGFLSDYIIPLVERLATLFADGLIWAIDWLVKGFDALYEALKPVWEWLKPIVDGLMMIAGIQPGSLKKTIEINYKVDPGTTGENNRFNNIAREAGLLPPAVTSSTITPPKTPKAPKNDGAAEAAKKARQAAIKERAALKKVIADTRQAFFDARQDYQDEIADINERFEKRRDDIGKAYDKDVAAANKRFSEQTAEITKRYNESVTKATEARDSSLASALKQHNQNIAKIQDDFAKRQADLITQSMNRLRDAYRSAVQVNVASIFNSDQLAGSIEGTVEVLREKLLASRRLLANAAALSAAGFSQTFIEQVIGAGTDVGNELAESILGATPETKAELKALYSSLEQESESGMDQLAKQIYDQAGLATTELRNLYSANQVALNEALAAENLAYQETVAGINEEFSKSIAQAEVMRNEALAEAQAALDESLLEAKIKRDDALVEAEEDFQDALLKAADDYTKDLEKIEATFNEKVGNMKSAAAGLAGEIAGLQSALSQAQSDVRAVTGGGGGGSAMPWQFMAEGGLVTSATPAIIGEAGPEVVIPLDRFESMMNMGSGGPSVTYYAAPNQSIDAERDLFQAMKRAKVVVGW